MQQSDRPEVIAQLEKLYGAYDRPITEAKVDGYMAALKNMTLIQFARCVDYELAQLEHDAHPEKRKPPPAGVFWTLLKALKAPGTALVLAPPPAPEREWHHYETSANMRLFKIILKRPGSFTTNESRGRPYSCRNPSESDKALIEPFIAMKNAWVRDMIEAESEGTVPADGGKEWWTDCMMRAQERYAAVRAKCVERGEMLA